jgi:alkanesulfonate monooxygenase SsuD/methylene tetrahydromethanopterin reductase-like flavin-dependent oxidoreductase (luciferase family)
MQLRTGVMLPSRETAMTGQHDTAALVRFARDAEQAGFDSVWTGDSPLARPRLDPFALLAAVATHTTRVILGTAALTAALRQPILGAHSAASVDQLSGGRLVLALGAGFPIPESHAEFDAIGVPFTRRAGRLDETVALWRYLWTQPPATEPFIGRHWRFDTHPGGLPPARHGGPPLWLAGSDTARVITRAGDHYDGWLPFLPDQDRYALAWRGIHARATERGRDVTPALYATIHLDTDQNRARQELDTYLREYYNRPLTEMATIQAFFAGSVQHCLDWLHGYLQAGARHLVLRFGTTDSRHQLGLAAEHLLPALRSMQLETP